MSGGFKVGLNPLSSKGGNGSGQIVQIIKLPQNLTNNPKAQRLEGQITQLNNNSNTARIQTPQGDVDVKVQARGLEQGQRLQIDIPVGRPPRQARIAPEAIVKPPENNTPRNSNPRGDNITIRTPPAQTETQPSLTQKVIQKISQRISGASSSPQNSTGQIDGQQNQAIVRGGTDQNLANQTQKIAQQIAAQAVKNIPDTPQPLKPNDVVRILSAPPNLAQSIATQTVQNMTNFGQYITSVNKSLFVLGAEKNNNTPALQISNTIANTNTSLLNQPALSNNSASFALGNNNIAQTTLPLGVSVTQSLYFIADFKQCAIQCFVTNNQSIGYCRCFIFTNFKLYYIAKSCRIVATYFI